MIAMVAVLVAGLAWVVPAQASDASLRKAIKAQEKKADAAAVDFAAAAENVESVVGREQATIAVTKSKSVVKRLQTVVARERATTARVKRGRTQYLAAISRVLTGFKTFDQGLIAFDPDAPAAARRLFERSAAQLKSAGAARDRAAKLIGGLSG